MLPPATTGSGGVPTPEGEGPWAGVHRPDDRWIPLRPETLALALEGDAARLGTAAGEARTLAEALGRVVAQETQHFTHDLDARFARFNPDRETVLAQGEGRGQRMARFDLLRRLSYLLEKANFERLGEAQLEQALRTTNSQGIKVKIDPGRIERLEIFVRGQAKVPMRVKTAKNPIQGELREVEIYRRLAMIFQRKGDPNIALKMFREIPVADLESLLPHAEVAMNWLDRAKIIGGGAGALGGVTSKIFAAVTGSAAATGNLLWVGIVALFGVSARSFFGYRRARLVRNSQMTHNLYYQNVANNAAVLHLLADGIAAEEIKEALLTYLFCAAAEHGAGWDAARGEVADPEARELELDARIESWLHERFGFEINFDCPDGLETLDRLGLWSDRSQLRVVPPDEAVARLDAHWRERRSLNYHHEMAVRVDGEQIGKALVTVAPVPSRRLRRVRGRQRARATRRSSEGE